MDEVEFMKAKSEVGAYRKVHYYLSHVVRYFQSLERQHKKPHVSLKHIYSNLPEIFNVVNEKVKEHSEVVQMKDTKLWKHILKNWRLTGLKNVFLHKNWTDPFQWPAITVENLTECGCERGIAEVFVNNVNVWSRSHWKVGSTVEAWICDQQCWAVGTILQINSDGGVDRLVIGYDNGTRNIIKKTSKYLRPTIEKREMKKEWCYGLRTIPEDVRGEIDGKINFLQDANMDLESKILELTLENKALCEENEDMASVLEKYLKMFEIYDEDPEYVLDCEDRALVAENKYQEALKNHEEELKKQQKNMQNQIDELKKKLKNATSLKNKKSKHRIVKRGKTCPTLPTHKSRFPMANKHKNDQDAVTRSNGNSRIKLMQKTRRFTRKHPTTMRKKLPLEPSSFSYLNCENNENNRILNKESESGSNTDEETENFNHVISGGMNKEENWKKSVRNCDWNIPKSPRFRSISTPIKSTSSRKFQFENSDLNNDNMLKTIEENGNVALPTIMKAEAEKKKNNTPNQLCDDLVFLASRVSALQDKLKAYHHSRTRSRSISDSRSRSCSSDSEEIAMEDFISLEDMEKRLKCKQEENKTMLEELEMDVQHLKYSFDESHEKIQNDNANSRMTLENESRKSCLSTAKPLKRSKSKEAEEKVDKIPNSKEVEKSNFRKSPAKDCIIFPVLSQTEQSNKNNKDININILMKTMFAGAKTSNIFDSETKKEKPSVSNIAGITRRRTPNLSLPCNKEIETHNGNNSQIVNEISVGLEEAGEMVGGDIMNSPKTFDLEPEIAPQLAY